MIAVKMTFFNGKFQRKLKKGIDNLKTVCYTNQAVSESDSDEP